MANRKVRVVHYLNQFFGQIGGEEKADLPPTVKEGPLGPGLAFTEAFQDQAEIVATVICGDTYFAANIDRAREEVTALIGRYNPDVVLAGPAFNAGRYGTACGAVAQGVVETLKKPVVSGMHPENPGYEMYRRFAYIVETGSSAASLRKAVGPMARLALKLGRGEKLGLPQEEGYLPRGIRKNVFLAERSSKRAVDMLVARLRGEDYVSEYPMPFFDRVEPSPPLKDPAKARVALVTSGGIVPKGNPDKIESSSATSYARYDLSGVDDLTDKAYQTVHGGFDPVYANNDPDRVLPVDVMRELEKEGLIGRLHRYYYTTVGNGTSVANARCYAAAIAAELKRDGVQAVILTST